MLSRSTRALTGLAAVLCASAALAAPKPKPKPKPPAKRTVLGTTQLRGDQAVLGQEYTLGKESPMNIKLNSVAYSVDRLTIGDEAYVPGESEKYLILHYTLHNPEKNERLVRFDTFQFTAVDDTNTNREGRQIVGNESTRQNLDMQLKPGQKIDAYTFIAVPAKGIVPKLIIKSGDGLVLRYDLKGKIKPLTGPAVDAKAKDDATALAEVPAEIGKTCQVGNFDITVDSAAYSTTPIKDHDLDEGSRYFIINATVMNAHPQDQLLRFDTIVTRLVDQDGAEINHSSILLSASRDASFDSNLAPGKSVKVRIPAQVAKDQQVTTFSLAQGDNPRKFVFDATTIK